MQSASALFIHIPKSAFIISLIFHLGLALGLIFLGGTDGQSWLETIFGKKSNQEAQTYVQVDVVGLPDNLVNQVVNPLLPEVAKPESSKEKLSEPKTVAKDIMEENISKKQNEASAKKENDKKKKEEKSLEEALDDVRREQALKGLKTESGTKGRGKIKGNKLSEGTSSTGTVGTAKDKYVGILTESIKQQFNVFSWQQKTGLIAEVKLLLLPNGRVKWRRIVKPSRDALYDSAVLQAIDDAQPFPIPEDKGLIRDEITINFKP